MRILIACMSLLLLSTTPVWAGSCLQGDCQNGWGIYRWDDGSTFTGAFQEGSPDGQGEYIDRTGRKYHALYVDGQPVRTTPVTEAEEKMQQRHLDAERFNDAGVEWLQKRDYASAIYFFNKAISLWPDNPVFLQNYHRAKNRD